MNKGIRTNDSAWVIDDQEFSDGSCVTMNIKSGIKSQKGQVIQNYDSSQLGDFKILKGAEFFEEAQIIAYSDGSSTKLFQLKDGVYRVLPSANNSFNKDNAVDFCVYEDKILIVDGEHVIRYWEGGFDLDTGTSSGTGAGTLTDATKTWTINEWAGKTLQLSDGTEVVITSNTADTLSFTGTSVAGAYSICDGIIDLADSGAGTVPVGATKIIQWRDRIWAMGAIVSSEYQANEVNACARYDITWWDTAAGNADGDKGFNILIDNAKDYPMLNMAPTMSTLGFYKGNGIYILVGSNETDWVYRQLPVDSGVIGANTVARGVESVLYDSDVGIKGVKGSESLEASARYDVVTSISISNPIKNKIDELTMAKREAAFAIFYNDTYRCNYGDFVLRFNALANEGAGGIEIDAETEADIGAYTYDATNNILYGITKTTGDVYQLESGESIKRWRPIEMFNDSTEWTPTDCTPSDETTTGRYVYNSAVKFETASGTAASAVKGALTLDLSDINTEEDNFVDVYVWVEDISKISACGIRIKTDASNYYTYDFDPDELSSGLNLYSLLKTSFVATGSPDWSTITEIEILFTTTDASSIAFDLMRLRNEGNYVKEAITKSFGFTPDDEYIKNINEIRVWGQVNGSYLVNVDYFIDDSITPSGTFEVDLSSNYFGYYLADDGKGTDAGLNYIQDTTKTWTANEWTDYYVYLRATNTLHLITGNDSTILFIDGIGAVSVLDVDTPANRAALGYWFQKDYAIIPDNRAFYTEDLAADETYTANYGGGFDNVEFKENPYLRGKRIKLRFHTDEADMPFEIFGFQIVYEVLQHKP